MSHEIRVPRLGWSMEEGTFIGWLKKPGEAVRVGEPLFELEGEKATQAIEAVDAGVLHILPEAPAPGAVVAVGALLGYLVGVGESAPTERSTTVAIASGETPQPTAAQPAQPNVVAKPFASPRAKRIAGELGVDWTRLDGSGRDGRIREADVQAESARRRRGVSSEASSAVPTNRRRTIVERLRISQERTVPVTLTTTLDATGLVGLREQFKSVGARIVPAFTDIIACIVARVLARHLQMVARRQDDPTPAPGSADDNGFDIAIAVHADEGLVAPVLRGVGRKPLLEIAEQSKELIERARAGQLTAAEMQGGVFTITNLGAYGIDAFTPVINYPQVAILGLGAIRRAAVVAPDGSIVPRDCMTLSLTFDHAVVDGAPAAAFLRDLAAALTTPAAALLSTP